MSKRKSKRKPRLSPEDSKEIIRKLKKNEFKLEATKGARYIFSRIKNGERKLVEVHVHPAPRGKPVIKNIIRKADKTNKEWVSL
jgi:predicted RNA binding protein YcfA (HicA-like mRNA interferase family)